jgi:hypothetical protein
LSIRPKCSESKLSASKKYGSKEWMQTLRYEPPRVEETTMKIACIISRWPDSVGILMDCDSLPDQVAIRSLKKLSVEMNILAEGDLPVFELYDGKIEYIMSYTWDDIRDTLARMN